jgi:putative FmdB family regulatory protein
MPIYEYRCTHCPHTEEHLQKVSDPAPDGCSECGSQDALEKIVSHTSFQLKGDGWYKDLYASKKTTPDKPDKKASSADGAASPGSCGAGTGACGGGKCAQ